VLDPDEIVGMEKGEAERGAEAAFRAVLTHGPKIELDHHLVYHARTFFLVVMSCSWGADNICITFLGQTMNSGGCWRVREILRRRGLSLSSLFRVRSSSLFVYCSVLPLFFPFLIPFPTSCSLLCYSWRTSCELKTPQILGKHLEVGPSGRKVCLLSLPLFVTGAYPNDLIAAGKVQYGGSFYGYFFK
jgi:hypothetical protein